MRSQPIMGIQPEGPYATRPLVDTFSPGAQSPRATTMDVTREINSAIYGQVIIYPFNYRAASVHNGYRDDATGRCKLRVTGVL